MLDLKRLVQTCHTVFPTCHRSRWPKLDFCDQGKETE